VLALGVTQIIGWGTTFYVPAILSRPIAESLDLPLLGVLGAYSWALLLSGLLSRRIGALIDRYGAAPLLAGASLLAAAALALHATAESLLPIWIAWSLIGLGMRAMLYDGAFAALTALAGPGARRAISLLTLMGGLASTVFWPISHLLLESLGWRGTLAVYGALNLLICAPLHFRFAGSLPSRDEPHGRSEAPTSAPALATSDAPPLAHADARARWARIAVTLLATAFACHAFIWSSLAVHLPELLQGLGLGAGLAVTVASLMGPAQVLARSAELFAQRWLSPVALAVPVFAMLPLSLVPLALPLPQTIAAIAFVALYGCSNGLLTILRGALPLALIGSRGFGELLGRLAAPSLFVSALSPLIFGQVLEMWGAAVSASLLFLAGIGCTVAAAALVRHARRAPSETGAPL
jgi:MFS family permease